MTAINDALAAFLLGGNAYGSLVAIRLQTEAYIIFKQSGFRKFHFVKPKGGQRPCFDPDGFLPDNCR